MKSNEFAQHCEETILKEAQVNMDIGMQSYTGLVREFVDYLRERKTYWLAPLIFVLLMLATLGFFLEGSVIAPAIYSIF